MISFKEQNKNYILKSNQQQKIKFMKECFYDYDGNKIHDLWKQQERFCKKSYKFNRNDWTDLGAKKSNKRKQNKMDVDDKKESNKNE